MDIGQAAKAALEAARQIQLPTPADNATQSITGIADKTLSGDATFALSEVQDTPEPSKPKPKKKVKPKMTAKEKKERGVRLACAFCCHQKSCSGIYEPQIILERVCSVLPLEFRGGDPVNISSQSNDHEADQLCQTLRRQVEHVIESLMDVEGGLKSTSCSKHYCQLVLTGMCRFPSHVVTDMIKGDINQAKVNKCLIALVNRKVVHKNSNPVSVH